MREALLEAYLVSRVWELGGMTAKLTVAGKRGWPDRLVVLPGGRIAFAELKRPKRGQFSATQKVLQDQLRSLGVTVAALQTHDEIDAFLSCDEDRKRGSVKLWATGNNEDGD